MTTENETVVLNFSVIGLQTFDHWPLCNHIISFYNSSRSKIFTLKSQALKSIAQRLLKA